MEIVILLPAIMDNLKCRILDLVLLGKLQYFQNILLWPLFIFNTKHYILLRNLTSSQLVHMHYKLIIVKAARIPLLIKKFKFRSYSLRFQLDQMAEWKGVGLRRRMQCVRSPQQAVFLLFFTNGHKILIYLFQFLCLPM